MDSVSRFNTEINLSWMEQELTLFSPQHPKSTQKMSMCQLGVRRIRPGKKTASGACGACKHFAKNSAILRIFSIPHFCPDLLYLWSMKSILRIEDI